MKNFIIYASRHKLSSFLSLILISSTFSVLGRAEDDFDLAPAKPLDERMDYLFFADKIPGQVYEKNLFSMQKRKLNSGKTKKQAWSGSYWPMSEGSIANPYQLDRSHVTNNNTGSNNLEFGTGLDGSRELFAYRKETTLRRAARLESYELNMLSPAEKYDLVMGDKNFGFTQKVWDTIAYHEKRFGKITDWEGSCHGWSAAAIKVDRPKRPVVVETAFGQKITFYPTDLKALATYLYGNSLIQDEVRIDGPSCGRKRPAVDRKTGRVISPNCEGTDPALWHMTMVNLVGIRGESFIMNRNNKNEVWNQPIVSYSVSYFNPRSGKDATFEKSILSRTAYGNEDPYLDWRTPGSTHIVGVKMNVTYTKEPDIYSLGTDEGDRPSRDKLVTKTFLYDLELDPAGKILGGEWRAVADGVRSWLSPRYAKYPGFIWTLPQGEGVSVGDYLDAEGKIIRTPEYSWSGKGPVPADWITGAAQARDFMYAFWKYENGSVVVNPDGSWAVDHYESHPQPLGAFVRTLIEMSQ